MTYELCLEYGTYPLSLVDATLGEDQNPPEFIQDDQVLLNKLDIMNQLFHDLFATIESQFHYIGFSMPEKRAQIRELYDEVVTILETKYKDYPIVIEKFLL
ncbi:hypothetical protein [Streptococcus dysgalactiae]|uniref:hypothetical protein n=2 Tax=Streptococcus dysgalactiae TaxID=1334 RepID=UPI0001F8602B|nr:hypothetical protein [Streptococcus dysgalactiae]EFY02928.1 hypothetical protein SDD27957_06460 [Streptococcus dysgalactiae subsp. dysgalactiae ATCC 27957]MCB2830042.1 hypothetical protein [Streptococcus dysgalactiae subsp. dysgalactiae]MCB2831968.1 hypothetical protein [Streptococcus dysgalactiae subsp. dysgalactiae]MCB2835583.1 hypothetical protein [Streptococcus dysgalactiae subsp. dysgalactiae]MCB2839658.1 hypothetical protein [Streptococcus dysgalactiae subsp. dysgalactiae]